METTPIYQQPAFIGFALSTLVGGVSAIIGFTVWLIRQEGKLAHQAEKTAQIEADTAAIWKSVDEHKENGAIHFNQTAARLADEIKDARFSRIEADVKEIKEMVREMSKR